MSMRVTEGMTFRQGFEAVRRGSAELFLAQIRVATGRRILDPSEDPSGTARVLDLDRQASDLSRLSLNASEVVDTVDLAAEKLQDILGMISEARQLAVEGLNGTLSASDRESVASNIDSLLRSIISLANSRDGGRALFAGTSSATVPFRVTTTASGSERVVYEGDDGVIEAPVAPGIRVAVNVPGSEIFLPAGREATTYDTSTGALPGPGADTGTGSAIFLLAHDTTTYGSPTGAGGADPVSGLRPGSSSSAADTVLGAGHTVALTVGAGGAGTLALDGGSPVTFTGLETDLEVVSAAGDRIFVDVTGLTPGFSGSVTLAATGTVSADGGATSVPIAFTTDQFLVHAETGEVTRMDTSGVARTGEIHVTYGGTFDVFRALAAIRDGLRTASTDEDLDRIRPRLDDLDGARDRILEVAGELGARSARAEATATRLLDALVGIEDRRSRIADVDLAEATIALREGETVYQSALLMAARFNQISLLDFLG